MKVLAPRGWAGTTVTCPHCESVLKVETDDVAYTRDGSSKLLGFYAPCGYCHKQVPLLPTNIVDCPARVLKAAFEKVQREPFEDHFEVTQVHSVTVGGVFYGNIFSEKRNL